MPAQLPADEDNGCTIKHANGAPLRRSHSLWLQLRPTGTAAAEGLLTAPPTATSLTSDNNRIPIGLSGAHLSCSPCWDCGCHRLGSSSRLRADDGEKHFPLLTASFLRSPWWGLSTTDAHMKQHLTVAASILCTTTCLHFAV